MSCSSFIVCLPTAPERIRRALRPALRLRRAGLLRRGDDTVVGRGDAREEWLELAPERAVLEGEPSLEDVALDRHAHPSWGHAGRAAPAGPRRAPRDERAEPG